MEENQLAKYRQGNGDIVNITGLKQYSISDDHRHQTQELHLRNRAMHWHTLERVSFVLDFFRFSKKENKCSINMAKTMALLVVILRQCKYESMNILPVWLLLSGGSARRTGLWAGNYMCKEMILIGMSHRSWCHVIDSHWLHITAAFPHFELGHCNTLAFVYLPRRVMFKHSKYGKSFRWSSHYYRL